MKKIVLIHLVVLLGALAMAGCGPSGNTGDVSAEELMSHLVSLAEKETGEAGWIHVNEQIVYDVDRDFPGTLSNNTPLPLEQVNDTWYHVNERGEAYQYVNIMTTPAGDTVQISIFRDNVIFNITTNLVVSMNPYSLGALDYRFSDEMLESIAYTGETPVVEVRDIDGRQVAIFTIEEELDEPVTTDNYLQPVVAVRTVAYYDMETGFIFRLERYRTLADGSERTYYRTEITIETGIEPPLEILDYIAGII